MKKFALIFSSVAILTVALASQIQAAPRTSSTPSRAPVQRAAPTVSRTVQAATYRAPTGHVQAAYRPSTHQVQTTAYRATTHQVRTPAYRPNTHQVQTSAYRATTHARPATYHHNSHARTVNHVARTHHTPVARNHHAVHRTSYTNYHVNYGTRFNHGYYYRGRSHSHWSYQRFDARYNCTCYYDPCATCWYYWCEPAACYYPVTYCPYQTYCWSPGVVQHVNVAPPMAPPVTEQFSPPVQQVPPPVQQVPPPMQQPEPAPVQEVRYGNDAPPRDYGNAPSSTPPLPEPGVPAGDE